MPDILKKIYFRVKSQSNEFKTELGNAFTGDELFATIVEIQAEYMAGFQPLPEDAKWVNKLVGYIQPFPGEL